LKAYYAPIGQYKANGYEDLAIYADKYSQVKQYDKQCTMLILDGGLCGGGGASGAPYISHKGLVDG
jgi:hypothetical protein